MKANKKRRIEISVETHEIKIIRFRGGNGGARFCQRCGTQTPGFSPEQIAAVLNISAQDVRCQVEAGKFHLIDFENNPPLICGESLRQL